MEGIHKTLSTKHEFRENLKSYSHRRKFVVNIWGGGAAKSTMGIRNFNLRRSQLRKKWKVGAFHISIPIWVKFGIKYLPLNSVDYSRVS